jgi:hypothetical protein
MRDVLAERLLAKVMDWSQEDVARERPVLQALADYKYDEYHQYFPGMRFIESLALWLDQFDSADERKRAYDFVKSHLIFISSQEMAHLVGIAFPDFIQPSLFSRVATITNISESYVNRIARSTEYERLLRQSLYLGLSDGAHVDLFRRSNPKEISHEQVSQDYQIAEDRAKDMLSKLSTDIDDRGWNIPEPERRFRMLFLLDDFSGSGKSYLRIKNGQFEGKLHKVLSKIYRENSLYGLVDPKDTQICIVLYVATAQSLTYLKEQTDEWLSQNGINKRCEVIPIQTLPSETGIDHKQELQIMDLLEKYYDSSIENSSYKKGKHDKPYLGFDECALPLILSHNTPNNSIPILWFEQGLRKHRGLFPRVSRFGREA